MWSPDQLSQVVLGLLSFAVLASFVVRARRARARKADARRPQAPSHGESDDGDLIGITYEWIDEPLRASEILGLEPVGRCPPLTGIPPFLAVFMANRRSHSTRFNDLVEFDQAFHEIGDGRIASVLLMLEHDREQVERFLLAHELELPAMIGAPPGLEGLLAKHQDRSVPGQMVILNSTTGRTVVRVLLESFRMGFIPLASKKALIERVLRR
ncbi:MAG: hypothetical protein OXI49_16225 [Acidobacteriota bacterium]|nr:hypothetical protein [Acidobacteriota bacterium]